MTVPDYFIGPAGELSVTHPLCLDSKLLSILIKKQKEVRAVWE